MAKEASFITQWVDDAVEKAVEQAVREAEARAARKMLLALLEERFGPLSDRAESVGSFE